MSIFEFRGGKRTVSEQEFLNYLTQLVDQCGSQVRLAKNLHISPSYLNDVLRRGKKPGDKLLKALNCERVILYKKLK